MTPSTSRPSLCIGLALACAVAGSLAAAEAPPPAKRNAADYAGTKSCRMCHKKEADGNQYGKWEAGPHAKAVLVLATPEAKAVAAKLGIEDAQKSGKCLKCHATAYHLTESAKTEKITVAEGVTCESCHGPGKKYKSKTTMQDRTKAIAGGMIHPATKSCVLCHNEDSPTWNPERYTIKDGKKVGFDVKQAYEKIKHPKPAPEPAE